MAERVVRVGLAAWSGELGSLREEKRRWFHREWRNGTQKLKTLIVARNDLQEVIKPLLRDYRQAVAARFAEGHAFVESLPRSSPVPGSKPDKPELNSATVDSARRPLTAAPEPPIKEGRSEPPTPSASTAETVTSPLDSAGLHSRRSRLMSDIDDQMPTSTTTRFVGGARRNLMRPWTATTRLDRR